MRKTESEPDKYEIFEVKGCFKSIIYLILFFSIIIFLFFFIACGHVKQGEKCEAYHTGNTNHKPGK